MHGCGTWVRGSSNNVTIGCVQLQYFYIHHDLNGHKNLSRLQERSQTRVTFQNFSITIYLEPKLVYFSIDMASTASFNTWVCSCPSVFFIGLSLRIISTTVFVFWTYNESISDLISDSTSSINFPILMIWLLSSSLSTLHSRILCRMSDPEMLVDWISSVGGVIDINSVDVSLYWHFLPFWTFPTSTTWMLFQELVSSTWFWMRKQPANPPPMPSPSSLSHMYTELTKVDLP